MLALRPAGMASSLLGAEGRQRLFDGHNIFLSYTERDCSLHRARVIQIPFGDVVLAQRFCFSAVFYVFYTHGGLVRFYSTL